MLKSIIETTTSYGILGRMTIHEELTMAGGKMIRTPPHQMLIDWLNEELKRTRLSQSEASKGAGLAVNTISEIVNGKQPGLRVCIGLAQYFDVPVTRMLYMAGHISREEMEGRDSFAEQVLPLWQRLTPEQKKSFGEFLRSIVGDY